MRTIAEFIGCTGDVVRRHFTNTPFDEELVPVPFRPVTIFTRQSTFACVHLRLAGIIVQYTYLAHHRCSLSLCCSSIRQADHVLLYSGAPSLVRKVNLPLQKRGAVEAQRAYSSERFSMDSTTEMNCASWPNSVLLTSRGFIPSHFFDEMCSLTTFTYKSASFRSLVRLLEKVFGALDQFHRPIVCDPRRLALYIIRLPMAKSS